MNSETLLVKIETNGCDGVYVEQCLQGVYLVHDKNSTFRKTMILRREDCRCSIKSDQQYSRNGIKLILPREQT